MLETSHSETIVVPMDLEAHKVEVSEIGPEILAVISTEHIAEEPTIDIHPDESHNVETHTAAEASEVLTEGIEILSKLEEIQALKLSDDIQHRIIELLEGLHAEYPTYDPIDLIQILSLQLTKSFKFAQTLLDKTTKLEETEIVEHRPTIEATEIVVNEPTNIELTETISRVPIREEPIEHQPEVDTPVVTLEVSADVHSVDVIPIAREPIRVEETLIETVAEPKTSHVVVAPIPTLPLVETLIVDKTILEEFREKIRIGFERWSDEHKDHHLELVRILSTKEIGTGPQHEYIIEAILGRPQRQCKLIIRRRNGIEQLNVHCDGVKEIVIDLRTRRNKRDTRRKVTSETVAPLAHPDVEVEVEKRPQETMITKHEETNTKHELTVESETAIKPTIHHEPTVSIESVIPQETAATIEHQPTVETPDDSHIVEEPAIDIHPEEAHIDITADSHTAAEPSEILSEGLQQPTKLEDIEGPVLDDIHVKIIEALERLRIEHLSVPPLLLIKILSAQRELAIAGNLYHIRAIIGLPPGECTLRLLDRDNVEKLEVICGELRLNTEITRKSLNTEIKPIIDDKSATVEVVEKRPILINKIKEIAFNGEQIDASHTVGTLAEPVVDDSPLIEPNESTIPKDVKIEEHKVEAADVVNSSPSLTSSAIIGTVRKAEQIEEHPRLVRRWIPSPYAYIPVAPTILSAGVTHDVQVIPYGVQPYAYQQVGIWPESVLWARRRRDTIQRVRRAPDNWNDVEQDHLNELTTKIIDGFARWNAGRRGEPLELDHIVSGRVSSRGPVREYIFEAVLRQPEAECTLLLRQVPFGRENISVRCGEKEIIVDLPPVGLERKRRESIDISDIDGKRIEPEIRANIRNEIIEGIFHKSYKF